MYLALWKQFFDIKSVISSKEKSTMIKYIIILNKSESLSKDCSLKVCSFKKNSSITFIFLMHLHKLHHQITTLKWRWVNFSVYVKANKICLRESKEYQMSIAISPFNIMIYWYKKLAYGKDIYTALDLLVQFRIVNKCNLYFRNALQS